MSWLPKLAKVGAVDGNLANRLRYVSNGSGIKCVDIITGQANNIWFAEKCPILPRDPGIDTAPRRRHENPTYAKFGWLISAIFEGVLFVPDSLHMNGSR